MPFASRCISTQSAGLVAIHPIADAMADEFACFAWLLRAKAFEKFHYDPDGVFCKEVGKMGFRKGLNVNLYRFARRVSYRRLAKGRMEWYRLRKVGMLSKYR